MSNCQTCHKPLDAGTVDSIDCGGDCMECMATFDDPSCAKAMSWAAGFRAACNLLRQDANGERYGIGSMVSQWRADEVADDLMKRELEAFRPDDEREDARIKALGYSTEQVNEGDPT